jgi:hypothetical protein
VVSRPSTERRGQESRVTARGEKQRPAARDGCSKERLRDKIGRAGKTASALLSASSNGNKVAPAGRQNDARPASSATAATKVLDATSTGVFN